MSLSAPSEENTSRGEPPLWWKIVAGVLVVAFAVGVAWFVDWRSAPPSPAGAGNSGVSVPAKLPK